MRIRKSGPYRGSHIPVLAKLLSLTTGPVLELGSGFYSTTFLHWMCFPTRRKLVTYENNTEWMGFAKQFKADFHDVIFVEDWDKIDITCPWSIAFIDHAPNARRGMEVRRLRHADYLVLHDTERGVIRRYNYLSARRFYKYKWQYVDGLKPYTSIWSDKFDVTGLNI